MQDISQTEKTDYLTCVKQQTDSGDPLEDKINTKMTFTCTYYRCANACNTVITKGLSALPFKPLRCINGTIQVVVDSYTTFTAPENIRACPELGPNSSE